MTSPEGKLTLTCIYCGHTWSERLADLQQEQKVFYREGHGTPPSRTEEYLVQCPNCGRRMVVTVQVRGA